MALVISSLLPIAILVGLGALLLRLGFYGEAFRSGLERFVYWVALPCLIVSNLSRVRFGDIGTLEPTIVLSRVRFDDIGTLALTTVLVFSTLAAAAFAVVGALALRLPRPAVGVFVQASMRGNLLFMGLPVLVFALEGVASEEEASTLTAAAVLALAPVVLLYNVVSVLALLLPQHRVGWAAVPRLARSVGTNPLIIACVVGLAVSLLELALPEPIGRALEMVGDTAAALALVALGGALVTLPWRAELGVATAASLLKTAAVPALTYAVARFIGLDGPLLLAAMVFAATPTAVASYVLSTQLKGDGPLAASCVVVSTVLSLLSLGVVLYLFG